MATIIDSILSEGGPGKSTNGTSCGCGHCPQCQAGKTGAHRTWRERRNARYVGESEGETTRVQSPSPVARKSIPGQAARIIPVRGPMKKALENKWTNKMKKADHPSVKDRYARYADTVRNSERPGPDQSEKDLRPLFRRNAMVIYRPGRVIQILNYNIQSPHGLIRLLSKKATLLRGKRMPLIVLDARGQEKGAGNLFRLIHRLSAGSGYPAGNIKIVTW
jgi:hypothetical protein